MPDAPIVSTFAWMLQAFAPCFTAPSMESFVTLERHDDGETHILAKDVARLGLELASLGTALRNEMMF
ncbi:MAG TPA: hypothetical protein VHU80_14830 [Polyangiaceae bacterium]|jgi:hypothetical protein|nr:hypothetical protein [Polyangiaceae bacterium]